MRVMYVASNPKGHDDLDLPGEINDLQELLERGAGADPIEFRIYSDLRLNALTATIGRFRPDVLHFAAHGDGRSLLLSKGDGSEVELDGRALAALLKGLSARPRLVVLNACSSESVAAELVAHGGADWAIGTDATITNDAARSLTAALYQRLADGSSIGDAFAIATTHVEVADHGAVGATLHPTGRWEEAGGVRLVDPLRIVACLPVLDGWLDEGLTEPAGDFRPENPQVQFCVAGAPAAARQTVFFTDDESVRPGKGESLEEARSWIFESQPVAGEIWIADAHEYWGDMAWYVAVTTTDRRVVSASAMMSEALRRHYLDERWRGELPPSLKELVERTIAHLEREGGSRRGRRPAPRAPSSP
ncbi:CHAT domain-containing protein [Sphingomonas sp. RRHST34]|uniref:CHAT domain-containing protein n=1 Tax=Sphingomonas citri TaxID=2862499 RepID=A0ABS7BLN2_9SPHN|nr:CHAT domain-containing protein [Sphingomonas citri]MBW6530523.1 CHAT domain-containing protein [Sphingomonas citri]